MKLSKNRFPHEIHRYLYPNPSIVYQEKRPQIKKQLKLWYQHSFQKNNCWNRTQIYSHIKSFTNQELEELLECFELLFTTKNPYHQVFIRYIQEYQDQKTISIATLGTQRLKVDQNTYEEMISYFGALKRDGKINNTNKQIAKLLKLMIHPDRILEETTIVDRLLNKKRLLLEKIFFE